MHATLRLPMAVVAAATVGLTLIRLTGELASGPEWLFGRAAGGGGALLGIGWLIPVAGAWFGHRLARAGMAPPARGRSWAWIGGGLLAIATVFTVAKTVLDVSVATFLLVAVSLPLSCSTAFRAWPALARALVAYALTARLPILVITVLAVRGSWGTHYELLAPGSPPMSDAARTLVLCAAQLCIWVPLTVQIGCLAGLVASPRRAPRSR